MRYAMDNLSPHEWRIVDIYSGVVVYRGQLTGDWMRCASAIVAVLNAVDVRLSALERQVQDLKQE